MSTYVHRSVFPGASREELAAYHRAPGALDRLLPPAAGVRIRRREPLAEGSVVELSVPLLGPLRRTWVARHHVADPAAGFVDEQERGPFRAWRHEHRFSDLPGGAQLEDEITFDAPGGPLSACLVERRLRPGFTWRHERTRRDLERQRPFRDRPRLTVAVSGATGLVGGALIPFLTTAGHQVRPFVRGGADAAGTIAWDPRHGRIDEAALAGCDAVVHLAGATVAQRWSDRAMAEIRDSRVAGTRLVAEAVARCAGRVRTLVIASGINCYAASDAAQDEGAPSSGSGFLAEVVRAWEAAAEPARAAGVRVVHLRTGMVLSGDGGGLPQLVRPARLGLGGPVAGGRQWLSWIDLDDLVGLIHHALHDGALTGPLNAVAPQALPQGEFARTLGRVLGRPAFMPFPAFAVRAVLGKMGEELLLPSLRIVPRRAQQAGFAFRSPTLEEALRFQLALLPEGVPEKSETPSA